MGPTRGAISNVFSKSENSIRLNFRARASRCTKKWVPVRRQVGNGSVYVVGDAAGQVKVTTVGGIVTGFRGALGVAEAILYGGASAELRSLRRELNLASAVAPVAA